MNKINFDEIKKILLIKLRGIGDVVLTTIVLDNIKAYLPNVKIDFLTDYPSVPILKPLSQINNVIPFDRKSLINRIKLFFKVRNSNYDLIIDFFSNPVSAQITYFSGAKYRAGFPYKGRAYAYNIYGPFERGKIHSADLHLELIKDVGFPIKSKNLHVGLSENSLLFAQKFFEANFSKSDSIFCIIPGGGWQSKRCDPIKFAEIADELLRIYNNIKILLLWGPGDKEEAELIKKYMKGEAFLAPNTSLEEMAAVISKCSLVIANDSGPMHIAAGLKIPTLSINGPTDPKLQGPYGENHAWVRHEELSCIGCNLLVCPKEHQCFIDLPITKVIKKVEELIFKNNIKINA
jgi:lipopolysaccharide heptosyltransferase II